MKGSNVDRDYGFHGLGIALSGAPLVSEALHARLRQFPANGHGPIDLRFEFLSVAASGENSVERPRGRARPVYEPRIGEVVYFDVEDQLYVDYGGHVKVRCDLAQGHVRTSIRQSEADHLWLVSHPLFTLSLVELLKRRGRYSLHAAGACIDGRGLLLAGGSGAGKSTLTVALVRAGFGFLGDDMVFLVRAPDGLRALAFPDEVDVTDKTIGWFPELHGRSHMPIMPGWPKRRVWVEEVYGVDPVWECRPAAVVFPRVAETEASVLRSMPPDEALLELVPNVLLTDARSSQAHLDTLGELVRTTPCYRLQTGRDFDRLPGLLGDLLN